MFGILLNIIVVLFWALGLVFLFIDKEVIDLIWGIPAGYGAGVALYEITRGRQ